MIGIKKVDVNLYNRRTEIFALNTWQVPMRVITFPVVKAMIFLSFREPPMKINDVIAIRSGI